MVKAYKIGPVADEQVDSAFLLARLSVPALDLEDWRVLCGRVTGAGSDEVTVAVNGRGYVQGLAVSRGSPDRVLDVSSFVVVSAADEPGVGLELFRYLRARANGLGCRAIHLRLSDQSERLWPVDVDVAEIEQFLLQSRRSGAEPSQPDARPVKT